MTEVESFCDLTRSPCSSDDNFTHSTDAKPDEYTVAPTLKFQCENKSVLIVDLNPEMINMNEIVYVSDGATCTIEIQNTTKYVYQSIWYVDLAIFQ